MSEYHPSSRRHAVFEDDGRSGWLYLTAPGETRPVADAWVYNRIAPPAAIDRSGRSRPPPAIASCVGPGAVVTDPAGSTWSFRWSSDGEAVALLRDGAAVAAILPGRKTGLSANLTAECPWGSPLTSDALETAGLK